MARHKMRLDEFFFFHIVTIVPTAVTKGYQQPKINRRMDTKKETQEIKPWNNKN